MNMITDMRQDEVHMGQDDFPIGHLAPNGGGKMTNVYIPLSFQHCDHNYELSSVQQSTTTCSD